MKLGDEARCKITGIKGILTESVKFLTGCDRFYIQPPYDSKKKELPCGQYADVMAIEVVKSGAVKIPKLPEMADAG